MTLPLSGTRILTVEQYGAGPFGSMLLADMGAEVIKIEDPPPGATCPARSGRSSWRTGRASSSIPSTGTSGRSR